jgi:hypothetical protein
MFLELQIFRRGPQFHCRSRTSPSAETSLVESLQPIVRANLRSAGSATMGNRLAVNGKPILLAVKQALFRRLREQSTAIPVRGGGRSGFSKKLGRPIALLPEGCAIYLQPRCIWLGYESDRFARCDSACRNPIILFLPEHQTLTVAMVHIVA